MKQQADKREAGLVARVDKLTEDLEEAKAAKTVRNASWGLFILNNHV